MDAGKRMLQEFIDQRLKLFGSSRNDPTVAALSNMSPWFHFGVSPISGCVPCHMMC